MPGPLGTTFVLPEQPIETVEDYLSHGGGVGLDAARRLGPEALVEEVIASGLRGRGGAGFPTGVKWRSVQRGGGGTHYAVANGAEGEPATFKDRILMRRDPYRVVEGLANAACAVGATQAYCATKRKYAREVSASDARSR
jgi:formate dehydrogenase iron-sulfur subunit